MNFSKPNFSKPEGNVFGNLKSKLGFGDDDQSARGGRGARGSRNDFDEFEDDEYAYDDEFGYDDDEYGDGFYDDEFGDYGPAYDEADDYAPVNPVSTRPASTRSSSSRSNKNFPNLVSIDDVKAHTAVPDRLMRDPLPPRSTTSSRPVATDSATSGRIVVDDRLPARNSDASDVNTMSVPQGVYDPYEAYSSSAPTTHTPSRSITILRPNSYADVEQVAKIVKSGDVVVLALGATPADLSKRILDFSFGVASALDASVETPGDKVFAIAKGSALSVPETQALRNQGVL